MKKKKLNLGDLKVQSFVTSMDEKSKETVQGGARSEIVCSASGVCICQTEDCETEIGCDVTQNCSEFCFIDQPIRWW